MNNLIDFNTPLVLICKKVEIYNIAFTAAACSTTLFIERMKIKKLNKEQKFS